MIQFFCIKKNSGKKIENLIDSVPLRHDTPTATAFSGFSDMEVIFHLYQQLWVFDTESHEREWKNIEMKFKVKLINVLFCLFKFNLKIVTYEHLLVIYLSLYLLYSPTSLYSFGLQFPIYSEAVYEKRTSLEQSIELCGGAGRWADGNGK